jgi:hypothetical protein
MAYELHAAVLNLCVSHRKILAPFYEWIKYKNLMHEKHVYVENLIIIKHYKTENCASVLDYELKKS